MNRIMMSAATGGVVGACLFLLLLSSLTIIVVLAAAWCCLGLCELLRIHWWKRRQISRWMRSHGIRGPAPRFLSGNLQERNRLRKEATLHDMHTLSHDIVPRLLPDYIHWSTIYGKSFMFWWGAEPRLAVYDLELIKELLSSKHVYSLGRSKLQQEGVTHFIGKGLLMANGDSWTHQRRIVAPAFHVEKLKNQLNHMVTCTLEVLNLWDTQLANKKEVEIEVSKDMSRLAGDIIAKTEFSSSHEKGKLIFLKLRELQSISAKCSSKLGIFHKRIRKLKQEVESLFMEMIEARKETAARYRAQADDREKMGAENMYGKDLLGLMLAGMEGGGNAQKQLLMDECKTFFFAGHETTWLLLTWTMMLLAADVTWQERAREEAQQAMRHLHGAVPDFEVLGRLKVLGMILLESLRLYTPATLLARQALRSMKLGSVDIPAGVSLWVPVLAIHHDQAIWGPDAHHFRPARFSQGAAHACAHPMAFMPFSFGPRNCVGQNFAMMEAKLVLAMILCRFKFCLSPSYRHAPVCVLTLQPKHGVPIILTRLTPS